MDIFKACATNNIKYIAEYLNNSGDIEAQDDGENKSLLMTAISNSAYKAEKYLLEHGANPDADIKNNIYKAFHLAVHNDDIFALAPLMTSEKYLYEYDKNGNTVFHIACENNSLTCLIYLVAISNNAAVGLYKNKSNRLPLDVCRDIDILENCSKIFNYYEACKQVISEFQSKLSNSSSRSFQSYTKIREDLISRYFNIISDLKNKEIKKALNKVNDNDITNELKKELSMDKNFKEPDIYKFFKIEFIIDKETFHVPSVKFQGNGMFPQLIIFKHNKMCATNEYIVGIKSSAFVLPQVVEEFQAECILKSCFADSPVLYNGTNLFNIKVHPFNKNRLDPKIYEMIRGLFTKLSTMSYFYDLPLNGNKLIKYKNLGINTGNMVKTTHKYIDNAVNLGQDIDRLLINCIKSNDYKLASDVQAYRELLTSVCLDAFLYRSKFTRYGIFFPISIIHEREADVLLAIEQMKNFNIYVPEYCNTGICLHIPFIKRDTKNQKKLDGYFNTKEEWDRIGSVLNTRCSGCNFVLSFDYLRFAELKRNGVNLNNYASIYFDGEMIEKYADKHKYLNTLIENAGFKFKGSKKQYPQEYENICKKSFHELDIMTYQVVMNRMKNETYSNNGGEQEEYEINIKEFVDYVPNNEYLDICDFNGSNSDFGKITQKSAKKQMLDHMEFDGLIGLESVKKKAQEIGIFLKARGKDKLPSLHMVFKGNPGTGKTEIARRIGQYIASIDLFGNGKEIFVEASRDTLIGQYIGETEAKTNKCIDSALGGVLFIDEAHALYSTDESSRDFGTKALNTLVKRLEDDRGKFICIMAGYPKEMDTMLAYNPGLLSRVQFYLDFPEYSAVELEQIFEKFCTEGGYSIDKEAAENITEKIQQMIELKSDHFAEARTMRNIYGRLILKQAVRVPDGSNDVITSDDIDTLFEEEDMKHLIQKTEQKRQVGF